MNLELNNLTEEQKKQIIELANKFEQENEVDKLDYYNDWVVAGTNKRVVNSTGYTSETAQDFFELGLTAHTKEDSEKIRRRLLVEKELRDWAKKCKKPLQINNPEVGNYMIAYETISNKVYAESYFIHIFGAILFSEQNVVEQAIESIGQERLIRDYFGIDN